MASLATVPITGWEGVIMADNYEQHICPMFDLRKHRYHRSCWCEPVISPESDELVWLHYAADGRDNPQ